VRSCVTALTIVLAAVSVATPIDVVLYPTADVHTSSTSPDSNYEGLELLMIGMSDDSSTFWRIYLAYDLSGVQGRVESAKLRLIQYYGGGGAGGTLCGSYAVLSPWEGSTITWGNSPQNSGISSDRQYVGGIGTFWITWDVTPIVQDWILGTCPNNGLLLKQRSEYHSGAPRHGHIWSTEATIGDPPRLTITLSDTSPVERSTWSTIKALFGQSATR
jgi:hypothetical protein